MRQKGGRIPESEGESLSVVSDSLWPQGLNSPWNSPGQNTGVGSLSLLQGIFPTQGLNSGIPHWGQILYQLSHKGSPRILEWVAYPFSRGSSQPRNQTRVSCIAGGFLTNWDIRESLKKALKREASILWSPSSLRLHLCVEPNVPPMFCFLIISLSLHYSSDTCKHLHGIHSHVLKTMTNFLINDLK